MKNICFISGNEVLINWIIIYMKKIGLYDILDYIFIVMSSNFYIYQDYKVKVIAYGKDIMSIVRMIKNRKINILILENELNMVLMDIYLKYFLNNKIKKINNKNELRL